MSDTQQRQVMRNRVERAADPRTGIARTAEDAQTDPGAEEPAGRSQPGARQADPARENSLAMLYEGTGTRVSRDSRDVGQFEIPARVRNMGYDAQWIAQTIYGEPIPGSQMLAIRKAGWAPAKARDFRDFVGDDANDDDPVVLDGQKLYIRPLGLTHQAQREDYRNAVDQQQSRMAATREGQSLKSDEEGLADMGKVVRTVPITLEVEGETGTYGARR